MDRSPEEYSAIGLSRLVHGMRELHVPERPRFVEDLLCVRADESVYVFGAETQVLHGRTVDWLLASLVPKLDGSRTLAELRHCFPELSDDSFSDVLHLLQLHGMLEEGQEPSSDTGREKLEADYGRHMSFFSRYLRVTGSCRSRHEAQQRLVTSVVGVTGQDAACDTLATQLAAHGVAVQTPLRMGESATGSSGVRLVVCAGDSDTQAEAVNLGLERRVPMLFVDPERLTVGPLMVPGVTACPRCVALQRGPSRSRRRPRTPAGELWEHALLSRATQRVLSYLTLMYDVAALGQVETWDGEGRQASRDPDILRLPNCPTCGAIVGPLTLTFPTGHQENMAVLFHQASAIMPWELEQPALMQQHINARVVRTVLTAFREHTDAERLELDETAPREPELVGGVPLSSALGEVFPDAAVCDLGRLRTVLHWSAGGHYVPLAGGGYQINRYTAAGGNLGSAELYLLVRNVPGLAPGIYHYLLVGDTLERLGDVADADVAGLTSPALGERSLADADAIVVLVSDVAREFSKYSNRAYVYCLLDAGLMAHRIAMIAEQVGITAQVLTEFDDQAVQRTLGLGFPQSAPACIIALRGGA